MGRGGRGGGVTPRVLPPLLLILVALLSNTSSAAVLLPPSPGYVYRFDGGAPGVSSYHPSPAPPAALSTVTLVDDAPLEEVPFPFDFHFFGSPRTSLSIDVRPPAPVRPARPPPPLTPSARAPSQQPNGAVHMAPSADPPCCDETGTRCAFGSFECGISNSYRDLVAAFVMDLNPSAAPLESRVESVVSAEAASVLWRSVPVFYPTGTTDRFTLSLRYTFSATLFPSGRVDVQYEDIYAPWPRAMVGLRAAEDDGRAGLAASQGLVPNQFRDEWIPASVTFGPGGNGTYAPRDQVVSNRTLVWYPAAHEACMHPRAGPRSGGNEVLVATSHPALAAAAASDAAFSCHWEDAAAPVPAQDAPSNATAALGPGLETPAEPDAEVGGALRCAVPAGLSAAGELQLLVVARRRVPRGGPPAAGDVLYLVGGEATRYTLRDDDEEDADAPGGSALCDTCAPLLDLLYSGYCEADCNGDWFGEAEPDSCGVCAGGETGEVPGESLDCSGVCFGPFRDSGGAAACGCAGDDPLGEDGGDACTAAVGAPAASAAVFAPNDTVCVSPRLGLPSERVTVRTAGPLLDDARLSFARPKLYCEFGGATGAAVEGVWARGRLDCDLPAGLAAADVNFTVPLRVLASPDGDLADAEPLEHNALFVTVLAAGVSADRTPDWDGNDAPSCDDCSLLNTTYCVRDCAGEWRGAAAVDECGTCSGGTTGVAPNSLKDCAGYCGGPFVAADGAGTPCVCPPANTSQCAAEAAARPPDGAWAAPPGATEADLVQPLVAPGEAAPLPLLKTEETLAFVRGTAEGGGDDVRFARLELPFTFWFFGTPFRRVQVSPNGAVHLPLGAGPGAALSVARPFARTALQPSAAAVEAPPLLDDAAWSGLDSVAAALLTDFDPDALALPDGDPRASRVTATVSDEVAVVRWENMRLLSLTDERWDANPDDEAAGFTFSLALHAAGGVTISHESASDPALYGGFAVTSPGGDRLPRRYYSGVRPPREAGLFEAPSSLVPAVPAPALAAGGHTRVCMMGAAACAAASSVAPGAGASVLLALGGGDGDGGMACVASLPSPPAVSCLVGGVARPAPFAAGPRAFNCSLPEMPPGTTAWVGLAADRNGTLGALVGEPSRASASQVRVRLDGEEPGAGGDDTFEARCGLCAAELEPGYCAPDCSGRWRGKAVANVCGFCTGGETGREADAGLDCAGHCFGPMEPNADRPGEDPCFCQARLVYGEFPLAPADPRPGKSFEREERVSGLSINQFTGGMRNFRGLPMPGYWRSCIYFAKVHGPATVGDALEDAWWLQVVVVSLAALALAAAATAAAASKAAEACGRRRGRGDEMVGGGNASSSSARLEE